MWCGTHLEGNWLRTVGLTIHMGHQGQECPTNQPWPVDFSFVPPTKPPGQQCEDVLHQPSRPLPRRAGSPRTPTRAISRWSGNSISSHPTSPSSSPAPSHSQLGSSPFSSPPPTPISQVVVRRNKRLQSFEVDAGPAKRRALSPEDCSVPAASSSETLDPWKTFPVFSTNDHTPPSQPSTHPSGHAGPAAQADSTSDNGPAKSAAHASVPGTPVDDEGDEEWEDEEYHSSYGLQDCEEGTYSVHGEEADRMPRVGEEVRRARQTQPFNINRPLPLPFREQQSSCPQRSTMMVIVDLSGVHEIPVLFCQCRGAEPPDQQLLRMGLYPATSKRPRTAFTFRLLDDVLLTNKECRTSIMKYYNKLRRITNNIFPHMVPVSSHMQISTVVGQHQLTHTT